METNDTNTPSQAPAESTTINEAPASNKTGGNQLTTALIVIIVVLLFVMLLLSMNGQLFQSDGGNNADINALTAKNAQLRADANAERARQGLPPLPEDSSSARMTADRLQRDVRPDARRHADRPTAASLAGVRQVARSRRPTHPQGPALRPLGTDGRRRSTEGCRRPLHGVQCRF